MRRLIGKVVWGAGLLLVSSWLLGAMSVSAGAATTATTTTTTTTTQPAPNVNSSADGWLSLAAILFGVVVSAGLLWVVSKDRRESREAILGALSAGASDVTESDTPLNAAAAALGIAAPAGQLTITADHDSFQVGSTATLTAENNNQPVPCTWTFAPTGIVSTSGDGPNSNLVVTGVKAGTVTATAKWTDPAAAAGTPPRTGTKKLTVAAQKSSPVNFAVLGSGLGSSVLALLAISGAIALSFRGTFSAEIGTLLGTALGAGAAGAVSATHSANNNSQPPAPPKSGTT
jgi:hypothetical protein